ncbi:peptidoglycan-binding domain-containing protein [Streptomyces sp. NBC_00448]|uniref:peptidoglycan-binding domain-containing protein n=1 Tax=Streptomyces sp. NBC_00448 TaxID=2903652 RepID=UPI002E244565
MPRPPPGTCPPHTTPPARCTATPARRHGERSRNRHRSRPGSPARISPRSPAPISPPTAHHSTARCPSRPAHRGGATTATRYLLTAHDSTRSVDGDSGPATRRAVSAFRTGRGLTADGILDRRTREVISPDVDALCAGPPLSIRPDQRGHSRPARPNEGTGEAR